MLVTIPHHGGLGLKRFMARRLAKKTGENMLSASHDLDGARALVDRAGDRIPCAPGVAIETGEVAGLTTLNFSPENPRPGCLLYFHGGGYMVGSAQSHKPFVSHLSKALNIKAISVNYRLAPEHPCPAAPEDCANALKTVQAQTDGPIIVAGDSAGGGVIMAALLRHRDAGLDMPQAAYLISPWLDLTGSGASMVSEARREPMLSAEKMPDVVGLYTKGVDLKSQDASPLFADLKGLPPIFIQVGEFEILRDDTVRLAERLEAEGIPHRAEIWKAMFHVFQMFGVLIPEGRAAIKSAAKWLDAYL